MLCAKCQLKVQREVRLSAALSSGLTVQAFWLEFYFLVFFLFGFSG